MKVTKKTHSVTISHLSGCGQLMHQPENLGFSAIYRAIGNKKNAAFVCKKERGMYSEGFNFESCCWDTDNVNPKKTTVAEKLCLMG